MIIRFQPMTGKYKLLEDAHIVLDRAYDSSLIARLEKANVRKSVLVKDGYIMPKDTILTVTRWREGGAYAYPTFNIIIKENKGNPWAGAGTYLGLRTFEHVDLNVERI